MAGNASPRAPGHRRSDGDPPVAAEHPSFDEDGDGLVGAATVLADSSNPPDMTGAAQVRLLDQTVQELARMLTALRHLATVVDQSRMDQNEHRTAAANEILAVLERLRAEITNTIRPDVEATRKQLHDLAERAGGLAAELATLQRDRDAVARERDAALADLRVVYARAEGPTLIAWGRTIPAWFLLVAALVAAIIVLVGFDPAGVLPWGGRASGAP